MTAYVRRRHIQRGQVVSRVALCGLTAGEVDWRLTTAARVRRGEHLEDDALCASCAAIHQAAERRRLAEAEAAGAGA